MCDKEQTTSTIHERETIFIGVAWPYANGFIHLGHVAGSLLSPDIFSRFHRMRGNRVLMVSGSDEHGTPITVRAEAEGKTAQDVVDFFHEQTLKDLASLKIDFDLFTRTTHPRHYEIVQDLFLTHHSLGYIYPKTTSELFCEHCSKFLPDRYVNGTCPSCGAEGARGDQCDSCGMTYNAMELIDPKCKICGQLPVPKETEHFFFRLSAFTDPLLDFLAGKDHWKSRVLNFTRNWVEEGLKDRPITRDISWGVPVPLDGYASKRIYVWYDAVTGYLSASVQWAENAGEPDAWKEFWFNPKTKSYYFLGKDNVPFHTIIWPSMLIGLSEGKGQQYSLPFDVPANEFLQLGGEKFTKSGGIGIDVASFMKEYTSDEVRYYLSIVMPENRDVDFDLLEFKTHVNNELVATFGNFIHRVLSFTASNFGGIPKRVILNEKDDEALKEIESAGERITGFLTGCEFKNALKEIMGLASFGNRYLVERAPWKLIKTDREDCGTVLNIGLRLVKALGVFTFPFLPESMARLHTLLGMSSPPSWNEAYTDFTEDQYSLALDRPNPLYRQLELTTEEKAIVQAASQSQGKGKKGSGKGKSQPGTQDQQQTSGNKGSKKKKKKPAEPVRDITLAGVLLKAGKVLEVNAHPDAEKLYVLSVDVGEDQPRTLIAGLKAHYAPEELAGNTLLIVCNLRPAKLRGILSQGMMLAASDSEHVRFLTPEKPIPAGTRIIGSHETGAEPLPEITIDEFASLPLEIRKVVTTSRDTITLEDATTVIPPTGMDEDTLPPTDTLIVRCGTNMLHAGTVRIGPERPVAPGATIR
jgi:methionyl-tRNA synthetase